MWWTNKEMDKQTDKQTDNYQIDFRIYETNVWNNLLFIAMSTRYKGN